MNSFANSLKAEIARVARKELKNVLAPLRKANSAYRSEIAELKRGLKALRSQVRMNERFAKSAASSVLRPPIAKRRATVRFSAEALAAQRAKLGLSQAQMARLLDASALSIYKWESGKVQPRAAHQQRIFDIRKLGKREAAARLKQI